MALTVAQPTLSQPEAEGHRLMASKPIDLACPAPVTPDGAPLPIERAEAFAFRLFRNAAAGEEVWDPEGKRWLAGTERPAAEPLFPTDAGWAGLLVAIGQKDAAGAERMASDSDSGLPTYFVRCAFAGRDNAGISHAGESPPSPAVAVVAVADENRAGLAMEPDDPAAARELRVFLRDTPGGTERGRLIIRENGGIECVLEAGGATVTLQSDGDIVLSPAAARRVRIDGPLRVEGTIRATGDIQGNVP